MAIIDYLKNNGAITVPVKTNLRQEVEGKSFEIVLSETTKVASPQAVTRTDSVVLTEAVTRISKSIESSQGTSAHSERLERIRRAIEDGTYEINPNRIAAKMMQDAVLWN